MAKPFAWSFSALDAFEQCGRRYYHTRVAKDFPDPPNEAANWGKTVHKAIENRIEFKTPLPPPLELGHVEPIIQALEARGGLLRAEYKLALNRQFQPTEFFAKDAYVRAVGDVLLHNTDGSAALAMDWKTGKYKDGDAQLRLQAAVMFCHTPQLQRVGITYAWLKDKKSTVRNFERNEVPIIWREFLPRAARMEQAVIDGRFDPKPSGLCRNYCPVLSCEHNGRRK